MLESTVNVEENWDDDSHASARGKAKNSPSATAKHIDPRFAGGKLNMRQDNATNCYAGVQHYTQVKSDEESDIHARRPVWVLMNMMC